MADPAASDQFGESTRGLRPPSADDSVFLDSFILHAINTFNFRAFFANTVGAFLARADAALAAMIQSRLATIVTDKTENELTRTIDDIQKIQQYSIRPHLERMFQDHVQEVAEHESDWWFETFRYFVSDATHVDPDGVVEWVFTRRYPFRKGSLFREHLINLEFATKELVTDLLVQLLTLEAAPVAFFREAIGTEAGGFQGSIFRHRQNWVRGLAETTSTFTVETSQRQFVLANQSLIGGEVWVSILDDRTSQICQLLSMRRFEPGKGPYPPAHYRCRSKRVPYFKGFEPRTNNYGEWLRRQSAATQDKVLGKKRGAWFRAHPDQALKEAWSQKFVPRDGLTKRQIITDTYGGPFKGELERLIKGKAPPPVREGFKRFAPGMTPDAPTLDIEKAKGDLSLEGIDVGTTEKEWGEVAADHGYSAGGGEILFGVAGGPASQDFQRRVLAALERAKEDPDLLDMLERSGIVIGRRDPNGKAIAYTFDTTAEQGIVEFFEANAPLIGNYGIDEKKWTVSLTYDDPVFGTLTHELGHRAMFDGLGSLTSDILHDRVKNINEWLAQNHDIFRSTSKVLSLYSGSNAEEFAAELYAIYKDPRGLSRWPADVQRMVRGLWDPDDHSFDGGHP